MSRFTRSILAVLVAFVAASALGAQTQTASTTASTSVIAHLTLTATQAMILGSPSGNFAGSVVTSSDPGAQPALWAGTSDPGNNIQVQFTTLPTQLTNVTGGTVPFSCGNQAGVISGGSSGGFFNPTTSAGISGALNTSGAFTVSLGANGSAGVNSNNCAADLTTATHGTYSATITLTATVR